MAKTKEIRPEDLERELPPADDGAGHDSSGKPSVAVTEGQEELRRIKDERDLLYDRLARLQAEFDNYRKRSQREQQDFRDYAVTEAVRSLLPVLDSLDLALKNSEDQQSELRAGVELTRKQLLDALAKLGLREIPAEGEPFNPQYHQAIEMVDTSLAPDHQVLHELQRGYKLKDRLLRPAMVRVARNPKS
jgi:molecular chaperone GrpE